MDWTDKRPLAELTFGQDAQPDEDAVAANLVSALPPEASAAQRLDKEAEVRAACKKAAATYTAARVREILTACKVEIAEDIAKLGCTGMKSFGFKVRDIAFVRLGLAGSGVGLPCFVGSDKFCLAHNTVGGLMEGQAQLFPDQVASISRALTDAERGYAKLIEKVQRIEAPTDTGRMNKVRDALAGRELPEGWEAEPPFDPTNTDVSGGEVDPSGNFGGGTTFLKEDAAQQVRHSAAAVWVAPNVMDAREAVWKCPHHGRTDWRCRYCLASEIVHGSLEPVYALTDGEEFQNYPAEEIEAKVVELGTTYHVVGLYARVARWSRKLARD